MRVFTAPGEESSGYRSVFSAPPHWEEEAYAPPSMREWGALSPRTHTRAFFGRPGPERNIVLYTVLSLLTCGLFAPLWMYLIGRDLRRALAQDEPHPELDLLLVFVTCGVWWFYLLYKYPVLIADLKRRAGLSESHLPMISLILGVLSLGVISLVLMQSELNRLWHLAGEGA